MLGRVGLEYKYRVVRLVERAGSAGPEYLDRQTRRACRKRRARVPCSMDDDVGELLRGVRVDEASGLLAVVGVELRRRDVDEVEGDCYILLFR